MTISAALVKSLRDQTGLSMMDCKKALVESGGDMDKAQDWLRANGLKAQSKMGAREASEGRIGCFVDPAGKGAIIEVRCETAPVANTDDFIGLTKSLAQAAATSGAATPDALRDQSIAGRKVNDVIADVFNRLRENIQVARVNVMSGVLGSYVHHNGQVGVLAEFSENCPDHVRADVCMHIAALNPTHLSRDAVDAAKVEKEREAFREEAKGKPAAVVEKIVSGKIDRWFSDFVLLEQAFAKDDKQTVGGYLKNVAPNLTVKRFARFEVGGA